LYSASSKLDQDIVSWRAAPRDNPLVLHFYVVAEYVIVYLALSLLLSLQRSSSEKHRSAAGHRNPFREVEVEAGYPPLSTLSPSPFFSLLTFLAAIAPSKRVWLQAKSSTSCGRLASRFSLNPILASPMFPP